MDVMDDEERKPAGRPGWRCIYREMEQKREGYGTLTVYPKEDRSGWQFTVRDFGCLGADPIAAGIEGSRDEAIDAAEERYKEWRERAEVRA